MATHSGGVITAIFVNLSIVGLFIKYIMSSVLDLSDLKRYVDENTKKRLAPPLVLEEVGRSLVAAMDNMVSFSVVQERRTEQQVPVFIAALVIVSKSVIDAKNGGYRAGRLIEAHYKYDKLWPCEITAWNPANYKQDLLSANQKQVNDPDALKQLVVQQVLNRKDVREWLVSLIQQKD